MNKSSLFAVTLAFAGCSATPESSTYREDLPFAQRNPYQLKCRLGSALVCKTPVRRGQETVGDCECARLPYSLTGGASMTGPHRIN